MNDEDAVLEHGESIALAIRPVYSLREGSKRVTAHGSAVVVGSGPHRLLVTAEHVLSGTESKRVMSTSAQLVRWPKDRKRLVPLEDAARSPDLVWSEVGADDAPQWQHFVELRTFLDLVSLPDGIEFLAAGFPLSRNTVRQGEGKIKAGLMFATVRHASDSEYAMVGRDRRSFVVARYRQDGRTTLAGEPTTGAHPKGMSGGGLFLRVRDVDTLAESMRLVGFITEYHAAPGLLVAVRMEALLDGIGLQGVSWSPQFGSEDA